MQINLLNFLVKFIIWRGIIIDGDDWRNKTFLFQISIKIDYFSLFVLLLFLQKKKITYLNIYICKL